MNPILEVCDICKEFVGVRALNGVSFSCYPGQVHVLQGENGAGKSTILKIISGIYKPDSGKILFKGMDITGLHPNKIRQMGIAMVYQELTLLPELTVAQNIFLNQEKRASGYKGLLREKVLLEKASSLAQKYGISIDPYMRVGDLSVARQQMVEILKALALNPEVLILDEPTSSLAFEEVNQLYDIVYRIREQGTAIIFISHRLDEVFRFGDFMTVLKDGNVVGTVKTAEITHDEVISMMVGRKLEDIYPPKNGNIPDELIFEASDINVTGYVHDASIQVRRGEVLGIAALQGQGQTEFLEAIGCIRHRLAGKLVLEGKEINVSSAPKAIKHGIVYVPEDRKLRGLFLDLNIRENLSMESLGQYSKMGIMSSAKERTMVSKMIELINIKTPSSEQYVNKLSGGNQQKVVIGKSLAALPKVILFNEPTRGIDVEAKQEIYRLIRTLAGQGTAIVIYSSDTLELVGLCDRVLTMFEGHITSSLTGSDITEETIMRGVIGSKGGGMA